MLVTHFYMHKNGKRFLDRSLLEQVGDRVVEIRSPSVLSHGFPISSIVERLLDRVLSEPVRSRALEAVHQCSSYNFPSNKFINVWVCTGYEKCPSGTIT